jgi:hypothetical protein
MAFSIEILGVRWQDGKYSLHPACGCIGDADELMRDPRFRDVSHMLSYRDYMGILTVEEALDMSQRYDERVQARHAPEQRTALRDNSDDYFRKSLKGASFVLVHIYEWESGM